MDGKKNQILSDVTLDLGRGVTALLGRNGAGKTTLMRVLVGAHAPSTGEVQAEGTNIYDSRVAMRGHASQLGWVPQGASLPKNMTAGEFLDYAAWLQRVDAQDSDTAVIEALQAAGAAELRGRKIGRMSGGEKQRVVLAASLVSKPSLLLLDEPTVGLDPAQREAYLDHIQALGHSASVLYSTHLVDDVVRIADRVVLMDCGSVVWAKTREEVSSTGLSMRDFLRSAVIQTRDRNSD